MPVHGPVRTAHRGILSTCATAAAANNCPRICCLGWLCGLVKNHGVVTPKTAILPSCPCQLAPIAQSTSLANRHMYLHPYLANVTAFCALSASGHVSAQMPAATADCAAAGSCSSSTSRPQGRDSARACTRAGTHGVEKAAYCMHTSCLLTTRSSLHSHPCTNTLSHVGPAVCHSQEPCGA